ncbi:MAG: flagellar motor protein MotD [Pseudomonadales bacterium]|jgi:chemotaxis protein MotB|nr:flagellar motor protein MotD [Pseudomonadales bacterium]MCC6529800.1 flagellar motor protein MotD [Pseudomonadales bacterium]MCP5333864.1 flagellar motor protein MotD [Pseudomonadales bacterium]HMU90125.1 flagellar motor protein MotD [Pseudomonadales bacterium]HMW14800.1 flagellar motor protein MotD [Pseudomonadales bacterium]
MAKRHVEHEHENHERWLVSYADFITLLFAFFVVMYAVSSVNEGKMKVLSEAMTEEFRTRSVQFPVPPTSLKPIQIGELNREQPASMVEGHKLSPGNQIEQAQGDEAEEELEGIKKELEVKLGELIGENLLTISGNGRWLEIEINSNILFESGEAEPIGEANTIFLKLAQILGEYGNAIRVEGFTDDLPINTARFPSNWELSAARAARIVTILTKYGVDPRRMAAVGYGEYQPVGDNRSSEGRARNRRVVLVISADRQVRKQLDLSVDSPGQSRDVMKLDGSEKSETVQRPEVIGRNPAVSASGNSN